MGAAIVTARTAARKTRPNCFTFAPENSIARIGDSFDEGLFVSQDVAWVNLHFRESFSLENIVERSESNRSASLHPVGQKEDRTFDAT
jgi:hypothetical protein